MPTIKNANNGIDLKSEPKQSIPIVCQLDATGIYLQSIWGLIISISVVIDSCKVPGVAEAWTWSAIIIVCFKLTLSQL